MISVVIPVYNGERFVLQAVESVRNQTYADWELIIVNDGSTDHTAEKLEMLKDDPRIRIIHQKNGGVSAARNTAINAAKGTHVTFLDADDFWYANHLEVLAGLIERYPAAGLLATHTETHLVNGEKITECDYFQGKPDEIYLEDFFEAYAADKRAKMYTVCSTCLRLDAAKRAGGFPVGCRIGEDLGLSLWVSAYYPVVLSKYTTAVYQKENSVATKDISFDPDWYFFDAVQNILKDPEITENKRKNIRRVMDWFEMRRSRHYMIDGRRKEAIKAYQRIRNNNELGINKWLTGMLLVLPHALVKKMFAARWRSQV